MADGELRANFGATPFARTPPVGFSGLDAASEIQVIPASVEVVGATLTVEGESAGPSIGWSTTFKTSTVTLSDANLRAQAVVRGSGRTETIITGKKYWEITIVSRPSIYEVGVGWCNVGKAFGSGDWLGQSASSVGWYGSGEVFYNGGFVGTFDAFVAGDTISFAVDGSALWWRVNGGDWNGNPAANPATGAGAGFQGEGDIFPAFDVAAEDVGGEILANFGGTSFLRTPPSGFSGFDAPSSSDVDVFPGEVEIEGATLSVAGSPESDINVIPAFVEIVGSFLSPAGFGEIQLVPGIIEVIGTVLFVNDLAAASAINVVSGSVHAEGATLAVTSSEINVVPGEVQAEGATLLIEPVGISIVPGEIQAVGATLTVPAAIIVHVVSGEVHAVGSTPSVSGVSIDEGGPPFGLPGVGPMLTAEIRIG